MKTTAKAVLLTAAVLFLFSGAFAFAQSEKNIEKTLSPYFFVESESGSGDPEGGGSPSTDSTDHFFLKKTDVSVKISGVIAAVTVRQHYANEGKDTVHGTYIFPASTRAAVHGMTMTIGDRVIRAKIEEKDEARQIYETAKSEGKSASLLEQKRPNVFSMSVANILPGDLVVIELQYTELLVPTEGTYQFVYPTVVGPRYTDMDEAGAPQGEKWVKNPYLKEGSAPRTAFDIGVDLSTGMPIQEAVCNTHETDIRWDGADLAHIGLADPGDFGGDRDFILRYRLVDKQITSGLMLYEGETENFFLLMMQPPERVKPAHIPGREYIFVVDVSGSMNGFPLNTTKELLGDLVGNLRPTDAFNVLLFAGVSNLMAPNSLPATPGNLSQALSFIDGQQGSGGTDLFSAMNRAMAIPASEGFARTLVIVTDGYIHAENAVFESIQNNLNRANVFAFGIGSSVNRFLIEGMAKAGQGEPFVVTGPAEAPDAARRFREYIASPVLTGIDVEFEGFDAYDVEPRSFPDLFAARPVLLIGKWRGEADGKITIRGTTGSGAYEKSFAVGETSPADANEALRYLWARTRISRLSDFNPQPHDPENRAEIVSLGLTYNLLTAFTSFVAVDEIIRNPGGEGEDVKQPLPLPKGVSNLAVSSGPVSVPEPELMLLGILCSGMLLIIHIRHIRRRRMQKKKAA